MAKTFLYPYKDGSASAKALAQALGIKRIKREGSNFKQAANKIIINWGSSDLPYTDTPTLNRPANITQATNKLKFFQSLGHDNPFIVPWTADQDEVRTWMEEGAIVVVRHKLTGHSGEGIELIEGEDDIPDAPLYTKYVNKKHEFRIHLTTNGIFDIQRKARKTDVPDENVNWKIRNLDGGFIYAREGFTLPDVVRDAAIEIFNTTGLDFGAVDIIYNEHQNKAYVLEINTAPGLTGTTLDKYVEAIGGLI